MTINEAIKILENYPPGACPDDSIEFNQAILLGLEALKRIKSHRLNKSQVHFLPLLGETKK